MFNTRVIAHFPRSVPVKNFESVNMVRSLVARFMAHGVL